MTTNSSKTSGGSVILIDSRVTGYKTLIDHLANAGEVFIIDAESDGVAQIAAKLQGRSDIDALHIISHGSQGALYLGSTVLDTGNLSMYAPQLGSIGSALAQSGDVLLYGCNVAQGDAGVRFINALAQATGADVAASDNATGASPLGGDAVLEQFSGSVAAASFALEGLTELLAGNTKLGSGMLLTYIGAEFVEATSIALQADGKILLAGFSGSYNNEDFVLVRYNSDGSLDNTFSGDGILTTSIGQYKDAPSGITVQADGKILLAGTSIKQLAGSAYNDYALVRYNSDGSLDNSFSGDGILNVNIFNQPDLGVGFSQAPERCSVSLQADGKILLAGNSYNESSGEDFALVRYNADGSLDSSFNGDGMLTTDIGPNRLNGDSLKSMTLQADGKILLAGTSEEPGTYETAFTLVRYNSDGSLDNTFSGDGILTTSIGAYIDYSDYAESVAVQPDGKILLAGWVDNSGYSSNFALVRYNTDGSLDSSFSGDGMLTTNVVGGLHERAKSMVLQADGKIVLAGSFDYTTALVRYNSDGSLDSGFSSDGMLTTSIEGESSITLQTDGKILLSGNRKGNYYGPNQFALVRLNSDGSPDSSFAANKTPTGGVTITATATQGQIITASNTLADVDGIPTSGVGAISYQWKAGDVAINGATASTFVLTQSEVGKTITVTASYTDLHGTAESVTSSATVAVANVNDTPIGDVTFTGTATQTQTLTGSNTLADADGIPADGVGAIKYQWKAGGADILGASASTYILSQAEVGKAITLTASYTDQQGTVERVASAASAVVANVNDAPTGGVTIAGTAKQGQTLMASNTLADIDGIPTVDIGAIKYQWKAGGTAINGATASTYALTQADVGKVISVTASYTDQQGTAESVTSSATAAVTNVNDAPTGSVTISGNANQGQTLSAANTLADADGLGAIGYQWEADGVNIAGATGSTFVLSQAQVGKAITVLASYTDMGNTLEAVKSNSTALVANAIVNSAPSFPLPTPGSGKIIIQVGESYDYSQAMTLQADGKILVAGYSQGISNTDFSLIRLNANGSLDTSFDGDAKVIIPVGTGGDTGNAMTLQADGKILAAGFSVNGGGIDFSLIRLNADGSLDNRFDEDGKAIIPVGTGSDYAYAMTLQADGKILVAGYSQGISNTDFSLIRLNANGSLDTSFDGDGKVIIPVGSFVDQGQVVALQADGKILAAGSSQTRSNFDFSVIRLNADGSLDSSFDGDGKAIIPVGAGDDSAWAMTLQADGKILVAGRSNNNNGTYEDFSVIRLNADGSLDSSFDGDGKAIIPVGVGSDYGRAITLQADGKILIAGDSDGHLSLIRLNPNGTLDTSFDGDGKAIIPGSDSGLAVTLQAEGKILVAGSSWNGSNSDFSLTRLHADGSLDTTLGSTTGSNTLGGTVSYLENAPEVVLDNTVAISDPELTALNNGQGNYSGASVILARSTGANAQDVFDSSDNLSFIGGKAVLSGYTIGSFSQSGGTLNIAFNSNATQARVNEALSSLTYANSSDAPPANVQINWTFSDGNSGEQGSGGALAATGSTKVNITAVNDAPTGGVTITGTATQGQTITVINTLADADGIPTSGSGAITYQWKAGGTAISGATANTYILTQAEVGKAISVTASYVDLFGQPESVSSAATSLVLDISPVVTPAIYWKDASKTPSETNKAGAVNLTDAISILKMIVGLSVNANAAPLSPYQAVAADFDQSGSVDLTDAIGVLKMVVGLSAPAPIWKYFDDATQVRHFLHVSS
jgi:uncharacterized delta-60 repeat protein